MDEWKPELRPDLDYSALTLDGEQGFVLSRIDGHTSVHNLIQLTGLSQGRIQEILEHLISQGAIVPPAVADRPVDVPAAIERDDRIDQPPNAIESTAAESSGSESNGAEIAADEGKDEDDEDDEDDGAEDADEVEEADQHNYRKLFETELRDLSTQQRTDLAKSGSGPQLCALCFDADPQVICALIANPHAGLTQARLVAQNHHHALGIEALTKNRRFVQDSTVQRFLLRNRTCGDGVLRKIIEHKALLALYKLNTSRELTDRARRMVRQALRQRFQQAVAEERVMLIFKTEGRCLTLMQGQAFDNKTVALLCRRNYNSNMLIQSLARFRATPPSVIAHLYRQPSVQRTPNLKKQLLRHPNCPSQIKRGF